MSEVVVYKPLITRHRPTTFKGMIGNEAVYKALQRHLKDGKHSHSYLLTGPSGTGKTTAARIIAKKIGAEVLELDAAASSGVESARSLVEIGGHMAMSGSGKRMIIIDECHALSKPAWQVLLKIVEEPPPHLYFAFCTTETGKVPKTIVTRCYDVQLRRVDMDILREWLEEVICPAEGWEVHADVITKVVQKADGSPRHALSILDAVHEVDDPEEVDRIITIVTDDDPAIQIARLLLAGKPTWSLIKEQLAKLEDNDLEAAIPAIARYIANAMHRASNEKAAARAWEILNALTFPINSPDPKVVFFAFVGRYLWSE